MLRVQHPLKPFLEHYKLAQLEAYQAEVFAGIMLFNNAARARPTPAETVSAAAIEIKCARQQTNKQITKHNFVAFLELY